MNKLSKVSFAALATLMVAGHPTTAQAGLAVITVPETGSTATLLGLAVLGLVAVGRKLRR